MDIKSKIDIFLNEKFLDEKFEDIIGDRFGRYSKYIIQDRAIPDVRDGLKPVQRRILYAMNDLGITANAPYKKCARIAGEVMGKYHPHGDSSIYEAMVRMSQDWKMSVSLIDMHGNNGSIDGDGPAAMRYTEARLSKNSDYLLKDIEKNTVPFIPNFDEEEVEPTVLPAKFPNLLVNGAMGISSGYATYIPTHNLNEVVNATIKRIDNPQMTIDELLEIMPGPDFPTGGIVQGKDGIREAFLTGSGSVIVRSKYIMEDVNKDLRRIVFTEIPFDTAKAKTVEKIEQHRMDGKIPDVVEVRDESDREGLRIAIDIKKDGNVDAILNYLFKNTDLQINLKYNMVSISERRPVRLGVIPILDAYINHQKEVITNRTNYELQKAEKRLHIVDGLVKMTSIVDAVIKTIRASSNKATSKENIINAFGFSELQAEAIVTMQLYRLSSTDITALKEEDAELNENIIRYHKILESEKELLKLIKSELAEVNKNLICPRKTKVEDEVADLTIDETDLISKEQVIICITREGYIKRASLKSYNQSKLNGLKEDDSVMFLKELCTLNVLLMFTNKGNYIYLPVYKLNETKFKDIGMHISSYVQLNSNEKIVSIYDINEFSPSMTILLCTNKGSMKQTLLSEFQTVRYTKPIRAMKLATNEMLVSTDITDNPLEIIVATDTCDVLRFRANEISLYGLSAGGLKSINIKSNVKVVSAFYTNKENDFLLLTSRFTVKRMKVTEVPLTRRCRSGSNVIKRIKTNPYMLVDAKNMTPNQYKEDIAINIIYKNGNDEITAFSLKYNVSDAGKCIMTESLNKPVKMILADPIEKDEYVSGDYLIIPKTDLFNYDDSCENEKPISAAKPKQNILNDLDKILELEGSKDDKMNIEVNKQDSDKNEKDSKETPFKKVSLFED